MNNRGPRSAAGKRAVANNHLKHGLTAVAIVLPSENSDEWASFHDDVRSRFDAEGSIECALASRVAELLWRLRRVVRAEQQSIAVAQMHRDTVRFDREEMERLNSEPSEDEPTDPDPHAGRQLIANKLGFYARVYIAGEAASMFEETLPVELPSDPDLEKIMKYEAHLSRLLNHALHELEALQDRRRGNLTHLARVDIH